MCLYHSLSWKKYMTGLMTNSPTPSNDARLRDAPREYATATVVRVPKILYDTVLRMCLIRLLSIFKLFSNFSC